MRARSQDSIDALKAKSAELPSESRDILRHGLLNAAM
jgi:hypothetical protein